MPWLNAYIKPSLTFYATLYANPPDNRLEAELLVDTALQKAAYAMHAAVHTTLKGLLVLWFTRET